MTRSSPRPRARTRDLAVPPRVEPSAGTRLALARIDGRGTLVAVSADPAALLADLDHDAALVVTRAGEEVLATGTVETEYPWASCTKLLTALATLVAIDRHLVGLDDPAGPEGATVRHLLAHASGVAFDSPKVLAAPGARRIYSNAGYELLADHVAESVGADFGEWAEESVLVPLGLSATLLEGSAAHGASGPVRELVALGLELRSPRLISTQLHAQATHVVYPGLAGVLPGFGRQQDNTWGLGPEIRGAKSPHWTGARNSPATFGHFGQSGSFLWIDPAHDLVAAFLGERPFGPWAAEFWPGLNDAIIDSLTR